MAISLAKSRLTRKPCFQPRFDARSKLSFLKHGNWLEAYAGARTIWLDNSVDFKTPLGNPLNGTPNLSASKSFSSPVLGRRFMVAFSLEWFILVNGGFGVDGVPFTGSLLGIMGYRTSILDLLTSLDVGYKAPRYNIDKSTPSKPMPP